MPLKVERKCHVHALSRISPNQLLLLLLLLFFLYKNIISLSNFVIDLINWKQDFVSCNSISNNTGEE